MNNGKVRFTDFWMRMIAHPEKTRDILYGNNDAFPIQVELTLTSRCNLDCVWCIDTTFRRVSAGDIDKDIILERLKEMRDGGLRGVVIEGGGEPTLYRDFDEVVYGIDKLGLDIGIITNGTLIPYIDYIDKIKWIRISLDTANELDFVKTKKVNMFNRVMKNIEIIAKTRKKEKTKFGISYILTKDNASISDIENLVKKLIEWGVDYLKVKPVVDHKDMLEKGSNVFRALDRIKRIYDAERREIEIDYFLFDVYDESQVGNGGRPCYAHSYSTIIGGNGDVYICCRLREGWTYDATKIGNIYKNTFREIWFGEKRQRLKKILADGKFCKKHCPSCRMIRYNEVIDIIKKGKMNDVNFV